MNGLKVQETDNIPPQIEFPISADNISDSLTKKWNTTSLMKDGAVNKLGRSSVLTTTGINQQPLV